jgi:hypothetical protein
LTKLYKVLDQDANFKEKFATAQEIGMRTLIEKMLILFDNKPDNLRTCRLIVSKGRKGFS